MTQRKQSSAFLQPQATYLLKGSLTIKADLCYWKLGQKLSGNRIVNSSEIVFSASFQKLRATIA